MTIHNDRNNVKQHQNLKMWMLLLAELQWYATSTNKFKELTYTSVCGTGFAVNGQGLMSTEVISGNISLFLQSAYKALSL